MQRWVKVIHRHFSQTFCHGHEIKRIKMIGWWTWNLVHYTFTQTSPFGCHCPEEIPAIFFQLPKSRIKSSEITSRFCASFETSYDFTWGLASSSDGPTRLWMILAFFFCCLLVQAKNSTALIQTQWPAVLLSALPPEPDPRASAFSSVLRLQFQTLIELRKTNAEKVADEKRRRIKQVKDATWRLWNCENIDSCSCEPSARWRLPRATGALREKLTFPWPSQRVHSRNQQVKHWKNNLNLRYTLYENPYLDGLGDKSHIKMGMTLMMHYENFYNLFLRNKLFESL